MSRPVIRAAMGRRWGTDRGAGCSMARGAVADQLRLTSTSGLRFKPKACSSSVPTLSKYSVVTSISITYTAPPVSETVASSTICFKQSSRSLHLYLGGTNLDTASHKPLI